MLMLGRLQYLLVNNFSAFNINNSDLWRLSEVLPQFSLVGGYSYSLIHDRMVLEISAKIVLLQQIRFKIKIKTILTTLFTLAIMSLSAQDNTEGETFHLTKQGAHYVFKASINGTADATILVESGIPALLVDSAFVFSSGILSDMELTVIDKEKLSLAGRVYKITHKANGTVRIGNNTSYVGDVFVLSNYDYGPYEVAVPVMYLHNDLDDGSRIVSLDLGNHSLQMLGKTSLNAINADYSKSNMNTDTYEGMFAIETSMMLDDGIKPRTLSGNFMIDFGNPELIFLLHQTEEVQSFLSDNADMELREATTPSGEVVGQFILTKQCQLCGIAFPDAVIVITKNLPLFTTPCNIGLKFFERVHAIFDFDQYVVYMKGK